MVGNAQRQATDPQGDNPIAEERRGEVYTSRAHKEDSTWPCTYGEGMQYSPFLGTSKGSAVSPLCKPPSGALHHGAPHEAPFAGPLPPIVLLSPQPSPKLTRGRPPNDPSLIAPPPALALLPEMRNPPPPGS